jgi:protein-S-isoprenylcysteine O-methyltransferase Ste14
MRRLLHSTLFWTFISAILSGAGTLLLLRVFPNLLPANPRATDIPAALESLGLPLRILASAAIWMVYGVYWSIAARGAAAPQQAESRGSRRVHETLAGLAQLLVLLPVPGLRARFLPLNTPVVAAGFAVQIGGLLLAIWARRTLGRFWSGAIATNTDHQLIHNGPYRLARHPIYTAILMLYLGSAIISGELHGLVGVALAIIAYARKIRLEEQHLRALFGPAYAEYQRETKALIPGLF